jgi:hypothetical protein
MANYAQAVLNAMKLIEKGETPQAAWEKATIKLFGEGTSGQKKGCPKNAFLGLCEEGKIKGVRKGTYLVNSTLNKNKRYVLAALELLKKEQSIPEDQKAFWQRVPDTPNSENGQLDVLFTLAKKGFINW